MKLKEGLENRIRGWLPKEPNLSNNKMQVADAKNKVPKPSWWKPLWMAPMFITFVSIFINFFLFHYPLSSVIVAVVTTDVAVVLCIRRKQKNRLKMVVPGWLPKEPHSSSYQRITKHKLPKIGTQIGIVVFIMGFVGGLLGALGHSLGLFSGLDMHIWPILIGMGTAIVAACIVIQKKINF